MPILQAWFMKISDTSVKISLIYTDTQTYCLMSHDEYKTFSICHIKYILYHFFKELVNNYLSFTTLTTDARKLPYFASLTYKD